MRKKALPSLRDSQLGETPLLWRGLLTMPLLRPKVSKSTRGSADNAIVQKGTKMNILTRRLGWRGVLVVLATLPVLLAGLFCLLLLAGRLADNCRPWEPRAQLFAFFVELDWEAKVEDVEELLQDDKYTLLSPQQYGPRDAGVFVIATPVEFGAGNWVLCLQFDNGTLVAKRIRIQDTARIHPSGAPNDETAHADVPCPPWLDILRE